MRVASNPLTSLCTRLTDTVPPLIPVTREKAACNDAVGQLGATVGWSVERLVPGALFLLDFTLAHTRIHQFYSVMLGQNITLCVVDFGNGGCLH